MRKRLIASGRHTAATSTLAGLMTWLGEAGMQAADAVPALLGLADQHAAAVRDALGDPVHGPSAVALAGYAHGVRDGAVRHGWELPDTTGLDWVRADWPTLRLLGVCTLARACGWA